VTTHPPRRIAVVGASAAGLATVETLRREGFDGAITLIGDESHPPYDRPPLTKQVLSGEWEPERVLLRPPADLDALGLDLRLGTAARSLDRAGRTVTLSDGSQVGYDSLVVATGVRPRRLPATDDIPGAHVLRTWDQALALKERLASGRRLVVVGAGFLGAEAAAVAQSAGADVTLLEPAPVPMARAVGPEVGQVLCDVHRDHGVQVRAGTAVTRVLTADGRATGVQLADGDIVPADDVPIAIGSLPNTEWLNGSDLRLDDGVVCDQYCAAAPGIYAAGDVARWYHPLFGATLRIEHRTNATEQGMAVARNLLAGHAPRPFAPVPYFWSDQYDLKIKAYGYLRGHDQVQIVGGSLAERRFLAAYRKGDRLIGVLAVGMPPKAIRPWRAAVAARTEWATAIADPVASQAS
jgi:NADPH-dependent 2,4-dienoyl-CoA reductase/sulfur reductase-like enzyme